MIGGLAPILIFHFGVLPDAIGEAIEGIPVIGSLFEGDDIQIPIPIYLDENLTGIYVDTETKGVTAETVIQPKLDGSDPEYTQRIVNASTTVNFMASKDSLVLMTLLAFCDRLIPLMTAKKYGISYLNGPVTIFNALLSSFNVNPVDGTDRLTVSMTLETTSKKNTTITPFTPTAILPTTGPVPLGGT